MLNKQEAFNLTWEKFVVGMAPRVVDAKGRCVYRLNGKPGCSVGLLIPDRLYTPELETALPTSSEFDDVAKYLEYSDDDREWLGQLQFFHDYKLTDEMTQPERVALYTKFAQEHGLKVPEAA